MQMCRRTLVAEVYFIKQPCLRCMFAVVASCNCNTRTQTRTETAPLLVAQHLWPPPWHPAVQEWRSTGTSTAGPPRRARPSRWLPAACLAHLQLGPVRSQIQRSQRPERVRPFESMPTSASRTLLALCRRRGAATRGHLCSCRALGDHRADCGAWRRFGWFGVFRPALVDSGTAAPCPHAKLATRGGV